ncbi:uncharacterized protein K460DRAFT_416979 [Cucurbitaria berberidis CBS 394.84]|uniref:Uncharacterized protein n=1 Tax=Cucurbitaria berberidis CBS 394.84 TaxID=1168544 RepID=A0A9P4GI02_9PLEO|nr:uncharacterized protein K460DRAFT_416979 [Cucurbitaria berberidis CBS 394.84]KAF1845776.1 hypothetical protein K460DRAFT_416979 [Cucurbitaria berberidis CBS 394.84]
MATQMATQSQTPAPTYPFLTAALDGTLTYCSTAAGDLGLLFNAIYAHPQLSLVLRRVELSLAFDNARHSGVLEFVQEVVERTGLEMKLAPLGGDDWERDEEDMELQEEDEELVEAGLDKDNIDTAIDADVVMSVVDSKAKASIAVQANSKDEEDKGSDKHTTHARQTYASLTDSSITSTGPSISASGPPSSDSTGNNDDLLHTSDESIRDQIKTTIEDFELLKAMSQITSLDEVTEQMHRQLLLALLSVCENVEIIELPQPVEILESC